MRKIKKYIVLSFVCALAILSCTKELDIIYSFAFNLEINAEDTAVINYQERTRVTIIPEKIVTDNYYEYSYSIVQGTGFFEDLAGGALSENTWYMTDGLILELDFIGSDLGNVEIELIVRDKEGLEETITITFDVIHNPFIWEVTTPETEVPINIPSPFSMMLENIGRDKSVTYETVIYFTQGGGELFVIDDSGNEISIALNTPIVLGEGMHFGNVVLSELGTSEIVFETTDSNGQVITETLTFEADVIDFTFEGTPQRYTIFVDEKINIEFLIQELIGGNDTYHSRYQFNSGNALLTRLNNGLDEDLIPGTLYPVPIGAYYWEFEGTTPGVVDMTFYAQNVSGIEHEVNIVIEVINGTFDFSAVETQDVASVNDAISINLNISETGNTGFPYNVSFSSTFNGVVTYNGVDYNAGDIFVLNQANSVVTYTGLEPGGHAIVFSATNSFGETKDDDAVIIFNEDDFAFSAEAENGNVFLNETTHFNFNILDNNDTSTYEIYYTVTGTGTGTLSSGGLTYLPGVRYNIIDSGTTWEFEGTGIGDLTYTFYVINNSGNEKSRVINISVLSEPEPDFNFTAVAETDIEYVNEQVHINFTIDETIRPNVATYSMVFTTSGTGIMTYLGNTYNAGETIVVSPENFVLVYEGLSSGIHDIEFTISNNNAIPISRTNTVSITFEDVDFSVDASPDNATTMCVNETENINVSLTQDAIDPSTNYTVVYSLGAGSTGTGSLMNGGGFVVNFGQSYPIAVGNTELQFEALTTGLVNIDVTITDSNGISRIDTVSFQINNVDFNLITSGDSEMFVNEAKNFNVLLSQEKLSPLIDYTIVYSFVGGTGTGTIQTIGGFDITPGQSYPISVGNTEMKFEALTTGDVIIDVTITDSNGIIHSNTITFLIKENDFNLITSGDSSSMFINTTEDFDVFLSQIKFDPTIDYTVVYTLDPSSVGTGTIETSGGVVITLGQSYTIPIGNTEMKFNAETSGIVIIDVTVTDSNGVSHSDTITYNVINIEYEFTGVPELPAISINTSTDLNFNINEISPASSGTIYEMQFEVTSGNAIISQGGVVRNPFTWHNVSTGVYAWDFTALNVVGNVAITFTVRNTITLEEKTVDIIVNVIP